MAKNVLPKHWNGSEFEELHIVTKASNVFTNDNKSVQQKIDDFTSHLADMAKKVTWVNAKSFGVIGDGIADDTVAMQNFVDFVAENGLCGFIPAGTYNCDQITYRDQTNGFGIVGESKASTIIKINGLLNAFDFRDCDGITIKNLTVDMNCVSPSTSGTGLYFVNTNNVTIDNIDIINVGYGALLAYTSDPMNTKIKNWNVTNVRVKAVGTTTDNIHPTGLLFGDMADSHFSNITVESTYYYSLEFKNECENIVVDNVIIKSAYHGIYLGGDGTLQDGYYCRRINFSNIICENVFMPVWFGTAKEIKLQGFTSYHTNAPATAYGLEVRNCINVDVSNSLFHYAGITNGFSIRDCDQVTVRGSAYRLSGTGRLFVLTNSTNANIIVDGTNAPNYNYGDVPASCTVEHSNGIMVINKNPIMANGGATVIRNRYVNTAGTIDVQYDPANNKIIFTFPDGGVATLNSTSLLFS